MNNTRVAFHTGWATALAGAVAMSTMAAQPAAACGGLFCSNQNPVNQAAERIIFSDNPDGTVTAVVEILYDGPSEAFSWLLPVPGIPEVGLSSTALLDTPCSQLRLERV